MDPQPSGKTIPRCQINLQDSGFPFAASRVEGSSVSINTGKLPPPQLFCGRLTEKRNGTLIPTCLLDLAIERNGFPRAQFPQSSAESVPGSKWNLMFPSASSSFRWGFLTFGGNASPFGRVDSSGVGVSPGRRRLPDGASLSQIGFFRLPRKKSNSRATRATRRNMRLPKGTNNLGASFSHFLSS